LSADLTDPTDPTDPSDRLSQTNFGGNMPAPPEPHPMTQLPNDTHPEIERRMIEMMRRMTPADKVRAIRNMGMAMRRMAMAEVASRYPDATEREVILRVVSRVIPPDLMMKAYGWDTEKMGY
jgi:hypothetical protein